MRNVGKDRHTLTMRFHFVGGRFEAMRCGLIRKEREPFSVREKGFWDVIGAKKLLQPKFTEKLAHKPDGLIFQPSLDVSVTASHQPIRTLRCNASRYPRSHTLRDDATMYSNGSHRTRTQLISN